MDTQAVKHHVSKRKVVYLCKADRGSYAEVPSEELTIGHNGQRPCYVCGNKPTTAHWLRTLDVQRNIEGSSLLFYSMVWMQFASNVKLEWAKRSKMYEGFTQ